MRSLRPKVLSRKPKPVPGWCKSLLLKKARTESTKLIEDSHLWLIVYIVGHLSGSGESAFLG